MSPISIKMPKKHSVASSCYVSSMYVSMRPIIVVDLVLVRCVSAVPFQERPRDSPGSDAPQVPLSRAESVAHPVGL